MRRFTQLYLDLDATNSTSEKIELLETYFREAPAADAAWALALLAGQRPKGSASTRALHDLAVEVAGVPESEAREAMRLASYKLGFPTRFVVRDPHN